MSAEKETKGKYDHLEDHVREILEEEDREREAAEAAAAEKRDPDAPELHIATPYDHALMNPYAASGGSFAGTGIGENPYAGGSFGAGPGLAEFGAIAPAAEEGTQAKSGYTMEEGSEKAEADDLIAALRTVHDPEIPVNIYDLGLIYDCVMQDNGDVDITMTLTAPACPVAGEMPQQVADAVADVEGVGLTTVTLTWEPPWRQDMMSEDARLAMDLY